MKPKWLVTCTTTPIVFKTNKTNRTNAYIFRRELGFVLLKLRELIDYASRHQRHVERCYLIYDLVLAVVVFVLIILYYNFYSMKFKVFIDFQSIEYLSIQRIKASDTTNGFNIIGGSTKSKRFKVL